MSDAHNTPRRKSDEEMKQEHLSEPVGGVKASSSREQDSTPDVKAAEKEIEIARLRQVVRDTERKLEENKIQREALDKELAELDGGRFGYYLIEIVYVVILFVSVGAWTVLGFAVWLPLLVRTTTLLAASVFYHSLFRDQPRVAHAQRSVNFAVRFYVKGFEHFLVFYRERHKPDPPVGLFEPLTTMKWKELLVECLWVIGVWAGTYFVVHSLVVILFRT